MIYYLDRVAMNSGKNSPLEQKSPDKKVPWKKSPDVRFPQIDVNCECKFLLFNQINFNV